MKRATFAACAVAIAVVAAYTAGAWSAAPPTPTEKKLLRDDRKLLRDVKALQAQVKTLQSQVKTDETNATKVRDLADTAALIASTGLAVSFCATAITADALQGTWQVIDQLSAATQAGKTYFGPQTPVDDTVQGQSICQVLQVTRSQGVPPTTATLSALLTALRQ
jgi:hypothetical protein